MGQSVQGTNKATAVGNRDDGEPGSRAPKRSRKAALKVQLVNPTPLVCTYHVERGSELPSPPLTLGRVVCPSAVANVHPPAVSPLMDEHSSFVKKPLRQQHFWYTGCGGPTPLLASGGNRTCDLQSIKLLLEPLSH